MSAGPFSLVRGLSHPVRLESPSSDSGATCQTCIFYFADKLVTQSGGAATGPVQKGNFAGFSNRPASGNNPFNTCETDTLGNGGKPVGPQRYCRSPRQAGRRHLLRRPGNVRESLPRRITGACPAPEYTQRSADVRRPTTRERYLLMKRVLLVIALAALGPLGMAAASAPGAAAAVASARASAAVASPATITGPSNFDCSQFFPIFKSGTNGGLPVYLVPSAEGCLDGIHACKLLGTYGGDKAVECVDIFVNGDPQNPIAYPVVSGICETTGGTLLQCANVHIPFDLNSPNGNHGVHDAICGHSAGPCDNPAIPNENNAYDHNSYLGDPFITPSGCAAGGSVHELWTVALSGGTIELPGSDHTVTSSSNMGSPHAIVCG
jgi:hypothetical protein